MKRALLAALLLLAGCDNMKDQESFRQEEPAARLPRGTSAQLPPPNTVPHRGQMPDAVFLTGVRDGAPVVEIPVAVDLPLLQRGRERYNIYCAVCHGADGRGQGLIVQRGFPSPPSLHDPRLRAVPAGHFFQVMTSGFGMMYPYADRATPADRWAIVGYIRALQVSQNIQTRDLPEFDRAQLEAP